MPLISGRIVIVFGLLLLIGGGIYVATTGTDDSGPKTTTSTPADFGGPVTSTPATTAPGQPAPADPVATSTAPTPAPRPAVVGPPVTEMPTLVRVLRRRFGAHARLRSLIVNEILIVVDVARGRDGTAAFLWRPETQTLERRDASPITNNDTIALSAVRPNIPLKLRTLLRRREPHFKPSTYNFFQLPVSRDLVWQISGMRGQRPLTFRARPDGSGLSQV
jgi:hypothetical protein